MEKTNDPHYYDAAQMRAIADAIDAERAMRIEVGVRQLSKHGVWRISYNDIVFGDSREYATRGDAEAAARAFVANGDDHFMLEDKR